jgi:hypothetical protein
MEAPKWESESADTLRMLTNASMFVPDPDLDPEAFLNQLLQESDVNEALKITAGFQMQPKFPPTDSSSSSEVPAVVDEKLVAFADKAEAVAAMLTATSPLASQFSYEYLKTEHERWLVRSKLKIDEMVKEAEKQLAKAAEARDQQLDDSLILKMRAVSVIVFFFVV